MGGDRARLFINEEARTTIGEEAPSRRPLAYHSKLPGYHITPLTPCPDVASALGIAEVWVKDESRRLDLPSFKMLGASWAIYKALDKRLGELGAWHSLEDLRTKLSGHVPLRLVAATDGNHGRAVARMAQLLGVEAAIYVPSDMTPARMDAIEGEGASCIVVDGSYDDAVRRASQEAAERTLVISDTSWEGYEEVPRWVVEGYSTIFWEAEEQLDEHGANPPDLVVVQIGVGALAAAAVRHFRRPDSPSRTTLLGVEPASAACMLASMEAGRIISLTDVHRSVMAGLNCGTPSRIAWPLVSRGFDAFVAIDDEPALEAMRMLAGAGLVAGETGAAGLGALVALKSKSDSAAADRLQIGPHTRALLISTEGATDPLRYERVVGLAPRRIRSDALA